MSSSGGPSAAQPPAVPTGVTFSTKDSAQQLNYSRGGLEVVGCVGGYRMARATEGVFSGNWYWEAEVLLPGEEEEQQQQQGAGAGQQEEGSGPAPPQQQEEEGGGVAKAEAGDEGGSTVAAAGPSSGGNGDSGSAPHFRMGWALRQADTQAPCGYDKNSYGYRDVDGAKVHKSLREDGYGEPYGTYAGTQHAQCSLVGSIGWLYTVGMDKVSLHLTIPPLHNRAHRPRRRDRVWGVPPHPPRAHAGDLGAQRRRPPRLRPRGW